VYIGRAYPLAHFVDWTRRSLYSLAVIGTVPVLLYEVGGHRWIAIPWTAVVLLGTATAFVVGFKNVQTYNRTWEARSVWGDIVASARSWGAMARDFVPDTDRAREMVNRHIAWITAMRYEMRERRPWETADKSYNEEYGRRYVVPERQMALDDALAGLLPAAELSRVLAARNKAAQVAALQSAVIRDLYTAQQIVVLQFIHMQREIKELFALQARSERIKDFPYPRQFVTVSGLFVKLFCLLLPFGLLREFEKLNDSVEGMMKGHMVWLAIPFSVLISWMYGSLEQVGEGTENPFEGNSNDVPVTQLSRNAEIDMLEMLGEARLPPPVEPQHDVVL
jgi:putative membrane protein